MRWVGWDESWGVIWEIAIALMVRAWHATKVNAVRRKERQPEPQVLGWIRVRWWLERKTPCPQRRVPQPWKSKPRSWLISHVMAKDSFKKGPDSDFPRSPYIFPSNPRIRLKQRLGAGDVLWIFGFFRKLFFRMPIFLWIFRFFFGFWMKISF